MDKLVSFYVAAERIRVSKARQRHPLLVLSVLRVRHVGSDWRWWVLSPDRFRIDRYLLQLYPLLVAVSRLVSILMPSFQAKFDPSYVLITLGLACSR